MVLRLRSVKVPPQTGHIALGGADAVAMTWFPSVVSAIFMTRPRYPSFLSNKSSGAVDLS